MTAEGIYQDIPLVVLDTFGGAYISWRYGLDRDVYLQHLTAEGRVATGWPANGLFIAGASRNATALAIGPDGMGGVLIVILVGGHPNQDVYAQRVLPDGQLAPGWPAEGIPVATAAENQYPTGICHDGSGGAYVVWDTDNPIDMQVYVQHLTLNGEVWPGWPVEGRLLISSPGQRGFAKIIPDGAGGALLMWPDSRHEGTQGATCYATRLTPSGSPHVGWPCDGVRLSTLPMAVEVNHIVSDGLGGAYIGWCDNRQGLSPINPFYYDIYAQHVRADGLLNSAWPADGLPVCTAPSGQYDFDMATDGSGGVYFLWEDYRNDFWQPFAQRIRPDSSPAPGWPINGLLVSSFAGTQIRPRMSPDATGGFYGFWSTFPAGSYEINGQRMLGNGAIAPGWGPDGRVIAGGDAASEFRDCDVTADGAGGAILAYVRATAAGSRVYAQRIHVDGPVATLLSFLDSKVEQDRATLRWTASAAAELRARVERMSDGGDWVMVGLPSLAGTDVLQYEDGGLAPGRYGYRLIYSDGTQERTTEATWIEVDGLVRLALAGFRPNPVVGVGAISFSLPDSRPATLSVHDVRGRRIVSRDVGPLGAGTHALSLDGELNLAAGVYWIRLAHADRKLTLKGIVIR